MSVFSDMFQYNTIVVYVFKDTFSLTCLHRSSSFTGIVVQVEGGIPPFLKTRPLKLSYHGIPCYRSVPVSPVSELAPGPGLPYLFVYSL